MVSQSEVGNAGKVRVYGPGVGNCVPTMEQAEFFVDTKYAGFGGLALSIEGPSKVIFWKKNIVLNPWNDTCGNFVSLRGIIAIFMKFK